MSEYKPILKLSRTDNDIVIDFDGTVSAATGASHRFRLGLSHDLPEWARTLLYRAIDRALRDFMVETRRQAYEDGWRDAKSKSRPKVQTFWSDFNMRNRSY